MKNFDINSLQLYLVTDRRLAGERSMEWIVEQAVEGGVTMLQLREKHCSTLEFIRMGERLKSLLKPYGIPLIINDRVDVALAIGADGVHIGQDDMPYRTCRRIMGPDAIIGLSIENFKQLEEAELYDVDYVAASPVFATQTKTDTARPWGIEGLREFVSRTSHPTVAIGGMNTQTAASVMQCGVAGIAVVSDIICAQDPKAAALALKTITGKNLLK